MTRTLLAIVAALSFLTLGLLTLLLLGLSTGTVGLAIGIVVAVLPVPVYMLLALWIDRFEKEPVWMLLGSFLWGATAAVFVAFIFNSSFEALTAGVLGEYAGAATAIISAPFIEELAKGLALLILFLWKRDEFDNVLDGIVYAAMTGLGFAMTENVLYYGRAAVDEGLTGSIVIFILRGIVSPFAHPLFTSMTGIGLGLSRQARSGSPLRWIAPLLGICAAMLMHFLWNLSASSGPLFLLAYPLVMVPAFIGVLCIVAVSLRKESRILREFLQPERHRGWITDADHAALSGVWSRIRASGHALGSGGLRSWRRRMRLHALASDLAFHRWRVSRGILPRNESAGEREQNLLGALARNMADLGFPPALPTAAVPPPLPAGLPPPIQRSRRGSTVVALASLGCLSILIVCGLGLGALVLIGSMSQHDEPVPVAGTGDVETRPLAELLPDETGSLPLQNVEEMDATEQTMLGAIEGIRGDYGDDEISVALLRYRSAEAAAKAIEPVIAAMFPAASGWKVDSTGRPARLTRDDSPEEAAAWNSGDVVVLIQSHTSALPQLPAPDAFFPPPDGEHEPGGE